MLEYYTTVNDNLVKLLKDDPVRPEIPPTQRVNHNSRVYVLHMNNRPGAVTCVKFLQTVPASVQDLYCMSGDPNTAVFYTIWSYQSGAGRTLIQQAQLSIQNEFPSITTFVTLSPKTEMARQFHLRNGAGIYRENIDTINYIYK